MKNLNCGSIRRNYSSLSVSYSENKFLISVNYRNTNIVTKHQITTTIYLLGSIRFLRMFEISNVQLFQNLRLISHCYTRRNVDFFSTYRLMPIEQPVWGPQKLRSLEILELPTFSIFFSKQWLSFVPSTQPFKYLHKTDTEKWSGVGPLRPTRTFPPRPRHTWPPTTKLAVLWPPVAYFRILKP